MIERLFYLLAAVVDYIKRLARKREQKESQDERDKLEENPADWYNQHFDGVRQSDDAADTDKADTERRGE